MFGLIKFGGESKKDDKVNVVSTAPAAGAPPPPCRR